MKAKLILTRETLNICSVDKKYTGLLPVFPNNLKYMFVLFFVLFVCLLFGGGILFLVLGIYSTGPILGDYLSLCVRIYEMKFCFELF